jgi:hypothetical protein
MPESKEPAHWRISDLWNNLITVDPTPEPRDYIRASELGASYLDRYLKMKGIPFTNPYSSRTQRIFACGNIFEHIVETVFRSLGILVDGQAEVKVETRGNLPVIGHYDHMVGGKIDIEKAKKILDKELFNSVIEKIRVIDEDMADFITFLYPGDWFRNRALGMAEYLNTKYPDGMKVLIAEIKSVNSRAFWGHKNIDPDTGLFKGYENHKLQLYTYLKGTDQNEGRRFYVSKDDLTLMESILFVDNEKVKEAWEQDVATMTKFYREDREPDKPVDFIYNSDKNVWEYNWEIARSPYFTLITGMKDEKEWRSALRNEYRKINTAECDGCKKPFTLATLNKNSGFCGKCTKKPLETKGGE